MELVLFCILLLVCALAMIEERLRKYNLAVYITLGIVLILFAGLREIGFDKDSENYEIYFYHYDDPGMELTVEYSFRFLSRIFYSLFGDVRSIFLYAYISAISISCTTSLRYAPLWFQDSRSWLFPTFVKENAKPPLPYCSRDACSIIRPSLCCPFCF